jgi:uracil-DNA glycosylase
MTLYSISEEIRKCTSCPLWKSRTLAVPGDGKGKIMVVLPPPTDEEDRLGTSKVKLENVFVTHITKCYGNTTKKYLKTCKGLWLDQQIQELQPEKIILVGKEAQSMFTNDKRTINSTLKDLEKHL